MALESIKQDQVKLGFWPSPQDYNEAIQCHVVSLGDRELCEAMPELNTVGIPKPVSGGFASVYRMTGDSSDWALRCFLRKVSDQEVRYATISDYINTVNVPQLIAFQYLPKGILVAGQFFPIVKMEWIAADTLEKYVEANCHDKKKMEALCKNFVEMITSLEAASISHGDLQHGNILVTSDVKLKLVDYDCMFVPGMQGLRSNELGHRSYQHPERSASHFGPATDRFSALLIYCTLRALCVDVQLARRLTSFNDQLLFSAEDLRHPESATVFFELESHSNNELKHLSKVIRMQLRQDINSFPSLREVADIEIPDDMPPVRQQKMVEAPLEEHPGSPQEKPAEPEVDAVTTSTGAIDIDSPLPPPVRSVRYNWSMRKTYCPIVFLAALALFPPFSYPSFTFLASILTRQTVPGKIVAFDHAHSISSRTGVEIEYRLGNSVLKTEGFMPTRQSEKYRIGEKIQVHDSWLIPQAFRPTTSPELFEKAQIELGFWSVFSLSCLAVYLLVAILLWQKPLHHLRLVRNGIAVTGRVIAKLNKDQPGWHAPDSELYPELVRYSYVANGRTYINQQYMPANQSELFEEGAPITILFDKANPKDSIIHALAFFHANF